MKKIIILILIIVIIFTGHNVGAYLFNANDVTYSNSNLSSTNVQDAIVELYNRNCPLGNKCFSRKFTMLKVGDYVKMTPTLSSFTIPAYLTGYSSDQTFTPSQTRLWRVIRINQDGTADAIALNLPSKFIYFSGSIGYANYIATLNYIANAFKNNGFVVRTRYFGYNGQTEIISDNSNFNGSNTNFISNFGSSTTSSPNQISSKEYLGAGDTMHQTDVDLVMSVIGNLSVKRCNNSTCGTSLDTERPYFIASRNYTNNSSGTYNFNIRYVNLSNDSNDTGTLDNSALVQYGSSWTNNTIKGLIRPVITIRALYMNGEIYSGDGSSSKPQELR